ncbi:MAG TPA: isoprenylcysteine carboxylmethyltransferase family protein [Cyclobacteriaceae bacterium]|nr:isoprenylcysteine carboxylmethyltransferase family protein [Cyclobacteriaceae bacterium]HRK55116.1 isoprenylcysteine carboxylmethyltransferase family protein [Cyclobacteriaceae bacterium]
MNSTFWMPIVLLISGWGVYFFLHSLLAANTTKEFFKQFLGKGFRFYRLGYVALSSIGLLFLLFWNASISSEHLIYHEGTARYLSLMFAAFGVIVIKVSFRSYRFSEFVGLSTQEEPFTTDGILRSVRHPMYSGTILIAIGYWLFDPTVPTTVSVICILIYLPIGIYLEERKLIKQFGDRYVQYKRDVPALIPKLF